MKLEATGYVGLLIVTFDGADLDAFSYWFGNRNATGWTDPVKFKRGEQLALTISRQASRPLTTEDHE